MIFIVHMLETPFNEAVEEDARWNALCKGPHVFRAQLAKKKYHSEEALRHPLLGLSMRMMHENPFRRPSLPDVCMSLERIYNIQ